MIEESEAVFYIETKGPNWGGEKRSKVRLLPCEEKIVIENPPGGGRCGFAAKKPLVIPYDLFLAVATKFCDNLQTRRRRIFDASQDIKVIVHLKTHHKTIIYFFFF